MTDVHRVGFTIRANKENIKIDFYYFNSFKIPWIPCLYMVHTVYHLYMANIYSRKYGYISVR